MLNDAAVYFRYLAISIRGQMQYRASFIMLSLGQFAFTGIDFVAVLVMFDRFKSLMGWTLPQVAFMYGLVNVGFAIADAATRGFDMFGATVKAGDFDRLLLRPRSTALQLAGQELTLRRVGRLAQGLIVLVWAAAALDVHWTPFRVLLVPVAVSGGAALFAGLLVLQATLAFWTTETLEIVNTVTYGGVETTSYPLPIYRPWFRTVFIFVIPLATISYFPSLAILGVTDPLGSPGLFQYLAPLLGLAFLVVCLQVWKFGVRHYRSTGS